jgi:hypothetical protein
VKVNLHAFITSALDKGEWPASVPITFLLWIEPRFTFRPLYLCGKSPRTQRIGGWLGSRAEMDVAVTKRK